ncbi:MAG TPA: cupin domain-containing protein [Bacteroidota bacterium]|nr:cupin domain-containing protein [Bacteroidota bacterium]
MEKIDIGEKFSRFAEHWRPKVIAALNGQEVKLVKFKGTFLWHSHENEDEFFLCWRGTFHIEFRDRTVTLLPGQCLVVRHGVEHRTVADEEVEALIFEPEATRNTGDATDTLLTAPQGVTI